MADENIRNMSLCLQIENPADEWRRMVVLGNGHFTERSINMCLCGVG